MKKLLLLILLTGSIPLTAQIVTDREVSEVQGRVYTEEEEEVIKEVEEMEATYSIDRTIHDATTIGMGLYKMQDTYLSPNSYTGHGFRLTNERMRITSQWTDKVSRQQLINVDIATCKNPAETADFLSAFVDYSLGYHLRMEPSYNFKILAGASLHGLFGGIYSTRNGNNPASAKCEIDLNFSAMMIYSLYIKEYPITLRYQLELPCLGVMFAPGMGQSYYEIFTVGNYDGVVQFTTFSNKFVMKNLVTADFPVGKSMLRVSYLNHTYDSNVNEVEFNIRSNTLMIGFVREFAVIGNKNVRKRDYYRSPYY